jgi:hypothetical protein
VPPDAVTVIPRDGSAEAASLPGVIATAAPAGDGLAVGDGGAEAETEPGEVGVLLPLPRSMMVVVLPVHPVSASASAAPAAAAETAARITLMSAPSHQRASSTAPQRPSFPIKSMQSPGLARL